jgi:hypothetical protein
VIVSALGVSLDVGDRGVVIINAAVQPRRWPGAEPGVTGTCAPVAGVVVVAGLRRNRATCARRRSCPNDDPSTRDVSHRHRILAPRTNPKLCAACEIATRQPKPIMALHV